MRSEDELPEFSEPCNEHFDQEDLVQFIGERGSAGAEANPRGLTASVARGEVKKDESAVNYGSKQELLHL